MPTRAPANAGGGAANLEDDGNCLRGKGHGLSGNFLHGIAFDNVAFLDVVELLHGHAALVVLRDLFGVVLEPFEEARCPS